MRRKRHEEHQNHEAWAIPYADLMTLLLAFFVVMYSVSVVNTGKFNVMSASMMAAFNGRTGVKQPVTVPVRKKESTPAVTSTTSHPPLANTGLPASSATSAEVKPVDPVGQPVALKRIEDQVRDALQPLIDKKLVVLRRTQDRLEVEIRTDILFSSGAARLSPSATTVLANLASILAPFGNTLRVEGFTDDVPIKTPLYPSNWELSAARAASVVHLFAEHGVQANRLGIVGWGAMRPIADNATTAGRNQNRRVLVVVEGDRQETSRTSSELDHLEQHIAMSPAPEASVALPTAHAFARPEQPGASASAPIGPMASSDALRGVRPDPAAPTPPAARAAARADGSGP